MEKKFRCNQSAALVETAQGKIKGYEYDGLSIFKGIPYGTAKRFHKAEPVKAWEGICDATNYGFVCPLLDSTSKPMGELLVPHRYWIMNEDCLNLNVWTPGTDDRKRPVMVWLHGGGFEAGSAIEQIAYEGENMAKLGDVVVVSVNHRLNILGFLDLSEYGEEYENSANAGMDDIILALKWVQENIAKFGGDPANVCVFGQSGGGAKVTYLLQSPDADGLFAKGIVMSGVIGNMLEGASTSGKDLVEALLEELSLSDVKELETVPYEKLAAAYNKVRPQLAMQGKYVGSGPKKNAHYAGDPVAFGFRKETSQLPLMVGSVFGEFASFAPSRYDKHSLSREEGWKLCGETVGEEALEQLKPLFEEAYPNRHPLDLLNLDFVFRAGELAYIRKRAEANNCTYSYLFDQDLPIEDGKTPWHCSDIPYFFHNCELVPIAQIEGVSDELEEEIFSRVMAFAHTGDPNVAGRISWPCSTATEEAVLLFKDQPQVKVNYDEKLVPLFAGVMGPIFAKMMAQGNIQH